MNCFIKFTTISLVITGLTALNCKTKNVTEQVPTPEEVNKITAAMPGQPAVKPEKPRKLLVFSISWGYKHSAIPYGQKAFAIMGMKTGAFETVTSDDIAMFEPGNLNQFDAVLFNNTNNEIFLPENFDQLAPEQQVQAAKRDSTLKESLVNFIASGKGLVVIHAGVASFRQWPEFGNIIGARFDNHPWNAGSTVTIKVDDPDHSVVRAFKGAPFAVTDEIYQVMAPYSRENLRVLLSIAIDKTDMTVDNIHREDSDFAMSWVKSYGNGRVFYNALGHQHDIFWNPVLLEHFLAGIQFALGDLPGDTTPSAQVKPK